MMTDNFEEMGASALEVIDEDLKIDSPNEDYQNPYTLDDRLLKLGYDYDSNGVYIPYNYKYDDDNPKRDNRDIYLKLERNPNKKCEMIYSWTSKEDGKYRTLKSFSRPNILSTEEVNYNEKQKRLTAKINKSISSNGILVGLNRTDDSFRDFFFELYENISNSQSLEVFKELDFDFPDIPEEDDEAIEDNDKINSFEDYPSDIQKEANIILDNGSLFQELQKSISLTHQGHSTSRDALILMEASSFVGDGVHGLLGGDSGEGKSDLAFAVGYNYPDKYVHILRNISPKNIYYDCETYNDDYNIVIFDDLPLNEDMINILKELSDNTKKIKELRTVINGKSQVFTLEGKFIVILTYAKNIPDEELKNRLFNMGVIVEKSSEISLVKDKIRENNVIGGNENAIVERNRLIIKASIHNLIEKHMRVFNPFLSIFNPDDYNNRDVNHFINMVKSKTFFEYYQRKQIKVNDDIEITIGAFEDFYFVSRIWSEDAEVQKYKLSEKQNQILKLLPEFTQDEAYDYVEDLNERYKQTQSKRAKAKLLDDESTKKGLSRKLNINPNTLYNLLDKSSNNTSSKSLIEMGLADKLQLDDTISNSPNIYYKIKSEGNPSDSPNNTIETIDFQFQELLKDSSVKQKVIINLLYYCNILVNEKGYVYLKNYCDNYTEDIDVKDYDSYFEFIDCFFDGFNYDDYSIDLNDASLEDINNFNGFKKEIYENIFEDGEKNKEYTSSDDGSKFQEHQKTMEKSSIPNPNDKGLLTEKINSDNSIVIENEDLLKEKGIDFAIAKEIYDLLVEYDELNLDEIRTNLCRYENPEDYNNESLPLKVEMNVKRLEDNDFLEITSYSNKAKSYIYTDKLKRIFEGDD